MTKARNSHRSKSPLAKPKKDEVIRFRLSADQKAGIEAAAARAGLDSSNWLRQLALKAAGLLPTPETA